jgi:hypothetical protein
MHGVCIAACIVLRVMNILLELVAGHETTFAALLFCLARLGVVGDADAQALVTRVFARYLQLVRKVQVGAMCVSGRSGVLSEATAAGWLPVAIRLAQPCYCPARPGAPSPAISDSDSAPLLFPSFLRASTCRQPTGWSLRGLTACGAWMTISFCPLSGGLPRWVGAGT